MTAFDHVYPISFQLTVAATYSALTEAGASAVSLDAADQYSFVRIDSEVICAFGVSFSNRFPKSDITIAKRCLIRLFFSATAIM